MSTDARHTLISIRETVTSFETEITRHTIEKKKNEVKGVQEGSEYFTVEKIETMISLEISNTPKSLELNKLKEKREKDSLGWKDILQLMGFDSIEDFEKKKHEESLLVKIYDFISKGDIDE